MMATGLSRQGRPGVRDTQSSAFFSTPGSALLYSGVAITTASATAMAPASADTSSGMPAASRSPS